MAPVQSVNKEDLPIYSAHDHRVRVLHVVESLETGGMERMVSALARALDPARFAVRVLCLKRVGGVVAELQAGHIPVHQFRGGRGIIRYMAFFPLARQMRPWAPDVVHTHNSASLFFGVPAARMVGAKRLVHTEHGRVFPDAKRYMLAERLLSTLIHRYVCVSDQTRSDVATYEKISPDRLCVIPNGVAASTVLTRSEKDGMRQALGIPRDAPIIGTIGRLVWEKDYHSLLRAFRAVRSACEEGVHLVIVGDGPERSALEAAATELEIRNAVHFVGLRSDVGRWHLLFDIFAMTSVSEGLPLALLEAMAAGRPIVATRVGGIPTALAHGSAGILLEPRDTTAMIEALSSLVQSPTERERLGHAAARRHQSTYSLASMTQAYVNLYTEA